MAPIEQEPFPEFLDSQPQNPFVGHPSQDTLFTLEEIPEDFLTDDSLQDPLFPLEAESEDNPYQSSLPLNDLKSEIQVEDGE